MAKYYFRKPDYLKDLGISDKQKEYHAFLLKFCQEHGLVKFPLREPKNSQDIDIQIKGLKHLVYKERLFEELFEAWKRKGEQNG